MLWLAPLHLQVWDRTVKKVLIVAWHPSLHASCSLRRFGGAMSASIGNSPVGVGHKKPVIKRSVSFSATSSFLL